MVSSVGTNLLGTSGDFYLGQVPNSANYYAGLMDEISLYQRPLNPQEVYSIYASGSTGKCPENNNNAPVVFAGPDVTLTSTNSSALLLGVATDDGLPSGSALRVRWSKYIGPGNVNFTNTGTPITSATFTTNGLYVLQLTADDGEYQRSSLMQVRMGIPCTVLDPSGLSAWWPANGTTLDVIGRQPAILGSGTSYVPGEVASCFSFDGANNFVWMPAQTNYDIGSSASGFTVEFWMNPTAFQSGSVLGWANGVRVERYDNNWTGAGLRCYLTGTAAGQYVQTPSFVWNFNSWVWTHVAVTYDKASGVGKMYINGSLSATTTVGT